MDINLQTLDIPTVADDGNGDKGRDAFDKVNDNFAVVAGALEDAARKAYVVPLSAQGEVVAVADYEQWRMPYAFVLMEVRASIETADSGGDIEIDIKENGASIFSSGDSLVIPSGSTTSVGYSPAPDVRYVLIEDNNVVKCEVTSASGISVADGLKVYLIGYVIWTTF
jgi:uncharacterized protein YuzE